MKKHKALLIAISLLMICLVCALQFRIRAAENRRLQVVLALMHFGEELSLTGAEPGMGQILHEARDARCSLPMDCTLFVSKRIPMPPARTEVMGYVIDEKGIGTAEVLLRADYSCFVQHPDDEELNRLASQSQWFVRVEGGLSTTSTSPAD